MLLAVLALATLSLLGTLALLLRRAAPDPAAQQLAGQLTRFEGATDARLAALDATLRGTISHLQAELAAARNDAAAHALADREATARAAIELRNDLVQHLGRLGDTLTNHLADFRTHSTDTLGSHRHESARTAEALRAAVKQDLDSIQQRLSHFIADAGRHQAAAQDALHTRLTELSTHHHTRSEQLRSAVEQRLDVLNAANTAKLEEMRATVDEKLQSTLHSRLTESFGQVTTHLGEVQKGLGEMKELATGVGDLKKVLSNVKARGVVGEFQLGLQLEQMFSPEQYVKNARIKPNSQESVEFALKFPGADGQSTLLAIDAKFPREDWERLEHAYEVGTPDEIAAAGKQFERAIRAEGRRICEKYIDPPTTLPHAVMFLPTEGLYAEVVRRPGLQSEIQQQCRVTIAGPSTFMAILTSFQMGFHTLAIEKKGSEVWNVLSKTKDEFGKFGGLMDKVEKQVGTVQNTLKEISGKTTTINRALKNVASLDSGVTPAALPFDRAAGNGIAPLLAAVADQEDH